MRTSLAVVFLGLASPIFVGCANSGAFNGGVPAVASSGAAAIAIQGTLKGGPQPISGAHIYLMEINPAGNNLPSVSLLTSSSTGLADAVGAYVLTDKNGAFSLPSTYACSEQNQVYLYALGGNAGAGTNSAAGLMAAVGDCPLAEYNGTVSANINEVSTVTTAYALAGFATDPTHFSYSGSALAQTGLVNAIANISNLYDSNAGQALQVTPGGNGVVPYKTINTVANILAACIQSSGPASSPCTQLLANAVSASGSAPTDTAGAVLNMAHNPGANVITLFSLASQAPSFGPALSSAPNDFTLGINFSGGGLSGPCTVAVGPNGEVWFGNLTDSTISKFSAIGSPLSTSAGFTNGTPLGPVGIAVDLSDNAWIVNAISGALIKYQSSGALLSPSTGYTGGGIALPQGIATDALGNVWTANYGNGGSVSKFSNGGTAISPDQGFAGGGMNRPAAVAIDSNGAIWVANGQGSPGALTKLSASGQAISPPTGFLGGGINRPFAIAIDNGNFAWVPNYVANSVSKLSSSGEPMSPSAGFTGGGLSRPVGIAVDGAGNVWVANSGIYSVSEIAPSGDAISPATGFTGGLMSEPEAVAVDGSGNVWVANTQDITVTELIGAAIPVVTPIAAGVKNSTLGARP